jgi:hypothetical protein
MRRPWSGLRRDSATVASVPVVRETPINTHEAVIWVCDVCGGGHLIEPTGWEYVNPGRPYPFDPDDDELNGEPSPFKSKFCLDCGRFRYVRWILDPLRKGVR